MAKSVEPGIACRCTYTRVPLDDEEEQDDEAFAGLLPARATAWSRCQKAARVLGPFVAIAVSAVINSLQAAVVKELSLTGLHGAVFEIILWRGVFQSLGCAFAYLYRGTAIRKWLGDGPEERRLLFWRGFIGYCACGFNYHAISMLPLAHAQVIAFSVPAFAAVFARLFLKEPLYLTDAVALQASFCGMVLIARPAPFFSSDPARKLGVLLALLSSACDGGAFVLVRALGVRVQVPWEAVVLAQATGQVVLSIPCMLAAGEKWIVPSPWQAVLLIMCGLMGFLSHAAMTYGMQRTESAGGSLVRQTLSPMCSFVWQAVFFHSDPWLWTSVMGTAVIFSGVLLTIVGKAMRERACMQAASAAAEDVRRVDAWDGYNGQKSEPNSPAPATEASTACEEEAIFPDSCKEGLRGL